VIEITVTIPRHDAIQGELAVTLRDGSLAAPCSIGRGGVLAAEQKREGDGATPLGRWPLRAVYYRADRITKPKTHVPVTAIEADMGWCDDPTHADYNRLVRLPFAASHELMARDDHVYDLVVVLGHNDAPPVAGMGSAIFWHLKRGDDDPASWLPTAGCIGTTLDVLYRILAECDENSAVTVRLR
jgi:L,D-peptidoglycan transpeptidase YkuD (ErfK/YbiS/YcfS/YnhG family)